MFKNWRVIVSTINMSDGESDEVIRKETKKEALDTFYDKCSKVGGNAQTKAVEITLINPNGDSEKVEKIDNTEV